MTYLTDAEVKMLYEACPHGTAIFAGGSASLHSIAIPPLIPVVEAIAARVAAETRASVLDEVERAILARDTYGTDRHLDESERAARHETLAAARIVRALRGGGERG